MDDYGVKAGQVRTDSTGRYTIRILSVDNCVDDKPGLPEALVVDQNGVERWSSLFKISYRYPNVKERQ